MKNIDLYKEFVDLTVPHKEMNSSYKTQLESISINPEYVFDNGLYKYEKRPDLKISDKNLANYVLYDLMIADQYFIPTDIISDYEKLWHWLSVFVGNYNIPNMRQHLTNEIYDNPDYKFDISKSSRLFSHSDYLIYSIQFACRLCIGTVKKIDFVRLRKIGNKIGFKIKEMK